MANTITYPSLQEVETADRTTICRWIRFLPFPKRIQIGKGKVATYREDPTDGQKILNRIFERYQELGGCTPEIAKEIGWE